MTTLRNTLAILLALASAIALPAHADQFADYAVANKRFEQMVARSAAKHAMPRMTEPETAKVLAILTDSGRFLEARPMTNKDMGRLMDMCMNVSKTAMAYAMFDVDKRINKSMTNSAEVAKAQAQLASSNAVTFQEEIIPLIVFQHRCLGKAVPLITAFATALKPHEMNSERLKGLVQIRHGVLTSFIGVASTATETGISLANRRKVFAMMTDVAPLYAQVLDLASRKQAYDYFNSLSSTVPPELAAQYRQITADLKTSGCTGLCSL